MLIPLWLLIVGFVLSLICVFILGFFVGVFMTAGSMAKTKEKQ